MNNLKNKKITLATLKAFIKKSETLFVESLSDFNGMTDCVEQVPQGERKLIPVTKEQAIGHQGVYCVFHGRDWFTYVETDTHYGIEVYNSCGSGRLLTPKSN